MAIGVSWTSPPAILVGIFLHKLVSHRSALEIFVKAHQVRRALSLVRIGASGTAISLATLLENLLKTHQRQEYGIRHGKFGLMGMESHLQL